ncbi:tetratricopeptide repeat protein [Armatimonas rosea]|uniref:Flp pilus assembly protein TadD n=1 Tax=Armatimonas rosea TaxID=685828 RepID=A0A7W9SRJ2_ARMRO|nr:hypothetical protein [Armatimonas rosea]MBB6051396.1 Flp pilus assembly protein TadD [Armatimonas rosea]
MKLSPWVYLFLLASGCEGPREKPKPLEIKLPAASPTPASTVVLYADIFRRRLVPPGTDTNVDRVETELAKHPKDPKALKAVGLAYYAAGGYEAAIKRLTGLEDPEAQLYLGYSQMALGNHTEALAALGKLTPNTAGLTEKQLGQALLEQGNIYFQALKKDDKAEAWYRIALRYDSSGEATLALGLLKASQGKTGEAQKSLVKASETLPAGKLRAAAFAALGRLESDPAKARAWYDKTRKDDPENPWLKKLAQ